MNKNLNRILIIIFSFSIILANQFHYVDGYKKDSTNKKLKIHDIKAGTLVKKIDGTDEYEILPKLATDVAIGIDGMVGDTQM